MVEWLVYAEGGVFSLGVVSYVLLDDMMVDFRFGCIYCGGWRRVVFIYMFWGDYNLKEG